MPGIGLFDSTRRTSVFPGIAALTVLLAQTGIVQPATAVTVWGTSLKPFAANSFWNSRPVSPSLGSFVIPTSAYPPKVGEGPYSLGVFVSKTSDPAATVYGLPGTKGIWDADSEVFRPSVTMLRWPADAAPATGSDGHLDIVDPHTGIVHSFFKLTKDGSGQWAAQQYAWTRIDGSGWGDPAHYYQGARAAGVPAMGGLIRKHEVADGDSMYRHALAMSLPFNALAPKPPYVFPATSADANAATPDTGGLPEGVLLMLPRSFDTLRISNLNLLSMRGPWQVQSGSAQGGFDTWSQSILFNASTSKTVLDRLISPPRIRGRYLVLLLWPSLTPFSYARSSFFLLLS